MFRPSTFGMHCTRIEAIALERECLAPTPKRLGTPNNRHGELHCRSEDVEL